MISQFIGSSSSTGLPGMSSSQYTQIQNKQNQFQVLGLLSGIPTFNKAFSSPFSSSFFNQVYDAKAMTPQVINNYMKQVDEVTGGTGDSFTPAATSDFTAWTVEAFSSSTKRTPLVRLRRRRLSPPPTSPQGSSSWASWSTRIRPLTSS